MSEVPKIIISEDQNPNISAEIHLKSYLIGLRETIDDGVHNIRQEPFCLSAYDEELNRVGGLSGWFSFDFAYIEILWVSREHRNQRIGSDLLRAFEKKSLNANCQKILTTNNSYNSSEGFWQKMGYEVFAELPDCPKNYTLYYLQKKLKF